MKTIDHHFLGDRVSVRCRRSYRPGETQVQWLGGNVIARDEIAATSTGPASPTPTRKTRYVVQLDDQRRVVAFDDDVRRFTLAFDIYETLEKMAS